MSERKKRQLTNQIHTLALIMAMAGLLSLLGWFLAGAAGIKAALVVALLAFAFTPRVSPGLIMARMGAVPLTAVNAPGLYDIAARLARKAGLEAMPKLYYLPAGTPNAFAMGDRLDSGIAVTRGLASLLTAREMAGILSHEITHIKNNDTRVMALSALFGRFTNLLSILGQVLLVFALPLAALGHVEISIPVLLIMAMAPVLSILLYQALSRTREFEADLGASLLLNDPEALASALAKVEAARKPRWPLRLMPAPAPLHLSHPPTRERIRRLMALVPHRPSLWGRAMAL